MKNIFLYIVITILVASCQEKEELKTIKIPNKYSLEIPSGLTISTELNDDASLQYKNAFKELYVIVIDEPKETIDNYFQLTSDSGSYLDRYTKLLKDNYKTSITNPKFSKIKTIEINGLETQTYSISGLVEGIEVYYELANIKGRFNYYQILTWTEFSRKEAHTNTMKAMIASFKELKNSSIKKRLPN